MGKGASVIHDMRMPMSEQPTFQSDMHLQIQSLLVWLTLQQNPDCLMQRSI